MTNAPSDQSKTSGSHDIYPVLPLRDIVVFPYMIVPLFVGREKSINALDEVMRTDKQILLAAQKNAGDDDPEPDAIYTMGTLATVLQLLKLPDGTVKVLVEGATRAKIKHFNANELYFEAEVERIEETLGNQDEIEAFARSAVSQFENYVKLNKKISPEVLGTLSQIDDYSKLADTIASHLAIKISDKQDILEPLSVSERLERVFTLMESEISVLQVEKKIRSRVKRQMEKTQREYYLNEQMKAIQKELGDGDERDDIAEFEEKIENTKLTKEAKDKALAELKKLKQMSPMSAEATVVRNYLDWLLSIPWGIKGKVKKDLDEAQAVLDEDHYGLEKVKERILEYLAVQKRTNMLKGPILCLVGPPGVGKTSLGKSIAKATGREFVRMSLGGVRDEAEIRGHRRTYIGSMPGKVIQSMRKAKKTNPLFLLDEIDKMGMDFRGDPGVGAAGGARPRAEPRVQRPLPGGRLRSVQRHVRDHGQHAEHSAGAQGPHGDHPARRLHRGREARNRQAPPHARADGGPRPGARRVDGRRRGYRRDHPPLHAGSWRAQPRTRDRETRPQGREGDRKRQEKAVACHAGQSSQLPWRPEVPLR